MLPQGVTIAHPDKLFIAGRRVSAHSNRAIELVSPDSEQVVGRVAEADEADYRISVSR